MSFGKGILMFGAAIGLGTCAGYTQHNNDRDTITEHVSEFGPCTSKISDTQHVVAQLLDEKIDFHQEFITADGTIQKYTFPQSRLPLLDRFVPYKISLYKVLDEIENGGCLNKKESE